MTTNHTYLHAHSSLATVAFNKDIQYTSKQAKTKVYHHRDRQITDKQMPVTETHR